MAVVTPTNTYGVSRRHTDAGGQPVLTVVDGGVEPFSLYPAAAMRLAIMLAQAAQYDGADIDATVDRSDPETIWAGEVLRAAIEGNTPTPIAVLPPEGPPVIDEESRRVFEEVQELARKAIDRIDVILTREG